MRFTAAMFFCLSIVQSGVMGGFEMLIFVAAIFAAYEDYLTIRNKR